MHKGLDHTPQYVSIQCTWAHFPKIEPNVPKGSNSFLARWFVCQMAIHHPETPRTGPEIVPAERLHRRKATFNFPSLWTGTFLCPFFCQNMVKGEAIRRKESVVKFLGPRQRIFFLPILCLVHAKPQSHSKKRNSISDRATCTEDRHSPCGQVSAHRATAPHWPERISIRAQNKGPFFAGETVISTQREGKV